MRWLCLLLVAWGSIGCTTNDRPKATGSTAQQTVPRPTIRDSGDIRIVEYPTLGPAMASNGARQANPTALQLNQLPPAIQIDSVPFLHIGGLQTDSVAEFDPANPMLNTITLSDGTIIAQDLTRIMYFTKDGRFLRASGRKGRGPGEFLQTRNMCLVHGDQVLVIDYVDQRVTVFDAEGKLLQAAPRFGKIPYDGCTPEGHVVIPDMTKLEASRDSIDHFVPYRIMRLDGSVVSYIGDFIGQSSWKIGAPVPWIAVTNTEVFVGNGRTFEITVSDRFGKIKRISRLLRLSPPVTDLDWEARFEAMKLKGEPRTVAQFKANYFANKPDRYPAFSQIRVDPAHRMWVSDYQSSSFWTVFDNQGVLLGRFDLIGSPTSRRELAGFGPDYLVIRYRDDDGALHLAFHRILAS